MKWFKHHSDTHTNLKTGAVIAEKGIVGYGFWWLCVELIASQGDQYSLGAEKNWKAWLIRNSGLSKEEVNDILEYFAKERLIDETDLKEARLSIPNLAEYCDDYESRRERKSTNTVRTKSDKVALEENRKEENRKEEVADAPSLIFERKILDKSDDYRALVKDLAARDYLSTARIHQITTEEFLPHWLERSEGAKKARFEKEKAFDYQRRLRTWITNFHKYAKDYRCQDDKWHRKGETCHCHPPEIVRSGPLMPSSAALVRDLAGAKRIT